MNQVKFAADVNHVGEIDHPDPMPQIVDPLLPVVIVNRITSDGAEPWIVFETVAAEALEMKHEHRLRNWQLSPILGLVTQDFDGNPQVEAASFRLRLLHDIGL